MNLQNKIIYIYLDLMVLGKTKNQPTLVHTIVKIDFILIHYGRLLPFEFDKINDVMMMKPCQS
jgi:hypothetical protein